MNQVRLIEIAGCQGNVRPIDLRRRVDAVQDASEAREPGKYLRRQTYVAAKHRDEPLRAHADLSPYVGDGLRGTRQLKLSNRIARRWTRWSAQAQSADEKALKYVKSFGVRLRFEEAFAKFGRFVWPERSERDLQVV